MMTYPPNVVPADYSYLVTLNLLRIIINSMLLNRLKMDSFYKGKCKNGGNISTLYSCKTSL